MSMGVWQWQPGRNCFQHTCNSAQVSQKHLGQTAGLIQCWKRHPYWLKTSVFAIYMLRVMVILRLKAGYNCGYWGTDEWWIVTEFMGRFGYPFRQEKLWTSTVTYWLIQWLYGQVLATPLLVHVLVNVPGRAEENDPSALIPALTWKTPKKLLAHGFV